MDTPPPHGPPPHTPPPPPPHPGMYPPSGYAYPYAYGAVPVRPGPAPGLVYAGFWIRFAAYLVDAVILGVPLYALFFALFGSQLVVVNCGNYSPVFGNGYFCSGSLTGFFFLGFLVIQLIHALYFVLMWSLTGSTIGQKVFKLRVVDARDGSRISIGKAVIRFLGFLVNSVVFNLGFMWAGWDPQKQGWHDKMATTFVVQRA